MKNLIKDKSNPHKATWRHPGGKLKELGPDRLSDAELLAILISTGIKNKSAEEVAQEIIGRFGSFEGLANQPFANLLKIRGLGSVKVIRIAACLEIARRIVNQVIKEYDKK